MTEPAKPISAFRSTALTLGALVVILTILITVLVMTGRTAPMPVAFQDASISLASAVEKAGDQHKVVFVVATADWCGPCQSYKRGALADQRVAEWIEANAIPVYLDVTEGASETTRRLGIDAIPASYVLDEGGKVLARMEGVSSPEKLLAWLEDAAGDAKHTDTPQN